MPPNLNGNIEGRNLNRLYATLSAHMNMTEVQVGQLAQQNLHELVTQINAVQNPELRAALQQQHNIRNQVELENNLLHLNNDAQKSYFQRWIAEPVNNWVIQPTRSLLGSGIVRNVILVGALWFGFKWIRDWLKKFHDDQKKLFAEARERVRAPGQILNAVPAANEYFKEAPATGVKGTGIFNEKDLPKAKDIFSAPPKPEKK